MRRHLYRITLGLIVFAALLIGGGIAWLLSGPHSVAQFAPYIEQALTPKNKQFRPIISDVKLQWDGWERPLAVHVVDMTIEAEQGQQLAHLSEAVITFDILSLLSGNIAVDYLLVERPTLHLHKTQDGKVKLTQASAREDVAATTRDPRQFNLSMLPADIVSVYDATVVLQDAQQNMLGTLKHASLAIDRREQAQMRMNFDGELHGVDSVAYVKANAILDNVKQHISVSGQLRDVNPVMICGLLSVCDDVPNLDVGLSGPFTLSSENMRDISIFEATLSGASGVLSKESFFPEPIAIESIAMNVSAEENGKKLAVDNVVIDIGGVQTIIRASAALEMTDEGPHLTLAADAENMPTDHLYRYWPEGLAPESRTWATESIYDGMATKADITLEVTPQDLAQEYLPDDFLKASVTVQGATINYIPGFPKAKKVNGVVHFTGTTLHADVESATALDETKLTKTDLTFTDLNHPNVPIEMTLNVQSSVNDVLEYIEKAPLPFEIPITLDNEIAEGTVSGKLDLAFDSFSGKSKDGEPNFDSVKYDIAFDGKQLAYPSLLDRVNVSDATGAFTADPKKIELNIDGLANGVPVQFKAGDTPNDQGYYHATLELKKEQFGLLGADAPDWFKDGALGLKVDVIPNKQVNPIAISADLTQADISVEDLNWHKPAGELASAEIDATLQSDFSFNPTFDLKLASDDLSGSFAITLDDALEAPQHVLASPLVWQGQPMTLTYKQRSNGDEISIRAKKLDVSALSDGDSDPSISDFPKVKLDMDIGQLVLDKNKQLYRLQGMIDCLGVFCRAADVSAKLDPEGYHTADMRIYHEQGERYFVMQATDAGNFLRKLDVVDDMYGGTLQIKGQYDAAKANQPLVGRVIITNYKLKNAPVLGKLLNLMSLPGLFETLAGEGMSFTKLGSDFVFVNDILTLKDARAAGPSIGVLAKGTVNLNNTVLNIDGSLVPAYALNSFVGKIPVIGQMLVGGEGEGVFAFNYSVKGPYDDPSVLVNPLSALTPGFTRKFFDIFETQAEGAMDTEKTK